MRGTTKAGRPTYEEILFWVRRPSMSYRFSLQTDRRVPDPYEEHQSLTFEAECIYPDRLKGHLATGLFFADPERRHGSATRVKPAPEPPKAVGSILIRKQKLDVGGFLPPEACWLLAEGLASGTITSMSANALWIKPGHAHLNSIAWQGSEFDPIAYIG